VTAWLRLTLLETGAMNSPRYPPAGPHPAARRAPEGRELTGRDGPPAPGLA